MRRRQAEAAEQVTPLRIRRYDARDWGNGLDAPQRWYDARTGWAAAGNWLAAADPDTDWPDVPFDPASI